MNDGIIYYTIAGGILLFGLRILDGVYQGITKEAWCPMTAPHPRQDFSLLIRTYFLSWFTVALIAIGGMHMAQPNLISNPNVMFLFDISGAAGFLTILILSRCDAP